jgi:hypothetical protein
MAILTADQLKLLGQPPRPPPLTVRLVDPDGTPSKHLTDFLQAQFEWLRRLAAILAE